MSWNPTLYSVFAAPRLRPALDMLARIGAETPSTVADLGCGTGNVTKILAERWPGAQVEGIDSSAEMLEAARQTAPTLRWHLDDIANWCPQAPVDVLFSNAALHWLDDHRRLLPRLMQGVAPGGWLAVQMPRNHSAPSHTCLLEVARRGPWRDRLEPLLRPDPVSEPADYYDMLAPLAAEVDIWQTAYLHVLEGANPVVDWVRATALRPLLDALDDPWRGRFLADYADRIRAAYPPQDDGRTLFSFRRLFIVARRPAR